MREQEYIEVMEQLRLDEAAEQKIIAACQENTRKYAPRSQPLRWTIGVAVLMLVIVGGVLGPRLFPAKNSFTIIAYAMSDEAGVQLSPEAASFDFQFQPSFAWTGGGGGFGTGSSGEMMLYIHFICEGKNISNITYTGELCRFLESVPVEDYQQWQNRAEGDKNVYSASWTATEGEEGSGEIYYYLESYTVMYAEQQNKNYALLYPLYAMEADYNGDYPIIMSVEQRPPSGVLHKAEEDLRRTVTQHYVAKEAYITVAVTFTDGHTESKKLLLKPLESQFWYTISIEEITLP